LNSRLCFKEYVLTINTKSSQASQIW